MRAFRSDADVILALREVAGAMPPAGASIMIVLAGASAALLGGLLARGRATTDCDVVRADPEDAWPALAAAAATVGRRRGLRPDWLSRDCRMYAWALPLEWRQRCEHVAKIHRLDVWRLSRLDLICAKILSAPKRPQDMEDLRAMNPTAFDLEFAAAHLDRLSTESLDNEQFEDQHRVLADLRGSDETGA